MGENSYMNYQDFILLSINDEFEYILNDIEDYIDDEIIKFDNKSNSGLLLNATNIKVIDRLYDDYGYDLHLKIRMEYNH